MKARHVMTPISAHLMRSCRVKKFDTNREWNLNQSDTENIIIIIIDKIANSKMSLKDIFYFNIIILTIYLDIIYQYWVIGFPTLRSCVDTGVSAAFFIKEKENTRICCAPVPQN